MAEKHTEGPWRVQPFKKYVSGGCRIIQAHKAGDHKQAQWQTEVCCTVGLNNDNKDQANARLIAAAPELLEALKQMVRAWDIWSQRHADNLWADKSRRIITQATGESE